MFRLKNGTTNNCLSCDNINLGIYLIEEQKNCEYSSFSGYYLDEVSKSLKKCYKSCKICKGAFERYNNWKS